jgi:hypothetical protein
LEWEFAQMDWSPAPLPQTWLLTVYAPVVHFPQSSEVDQVAAWAGDWRAPTAPTVASGAASAAVRSDLRCMEDSPFSREFVLKHS